MEYKIFFNDGSSVRVSAGSDSKILFHNDDLLITDVNGIRDESPNVSTVDTILFVNRVKIEAISFES